MNDDLRTRIAAVLRGYLLDHFIVDIEQAQGLWPEYLADAVIRELKLEREDGECLHCHAQLPCGRWVSWDE